LKECFIRDEKSGQAKANILYNFGRVDQLNVSESVSNHQRPVWETSSRMGLLRTAPWITLFPGVFIMPMALGINFLGDGLREVTDPKIENISDTRYNKIGRS